MGHLYWPWSGIQSCQQGLSEWPHIPSASDPHGGRTFLGKHQGKPKFSRKYTPGSLIWSFGWARADWTGVHPTEVDICHCDSPHLSLAYTGGSTSGTKHKTQAIKLKTVGVLLSPTWTSLRWGVPARKTCVIAEFMQNVLMINKSTCSLSQQVVFIMGCQTCDVGRQFPASSFLCPLPLQVVERAK